MKQVLDAEGDLPDDETPVPSRVPSADSVMTTNSLVPEPLQLPATQSVTRNPPRQQEAQRAVDLCLPDSTVGLAVSTASPETHPVPPRAPNLPDYFEIEDEDSAYHSHFHGDEKQSPSSVAATPPIPPKSLDRGSVYYAESSAEPSRQPLRRKPVPRTPTSGSLTALPTVASPADSALALAEKLTPLTQSLSSLTTSDHLNIELDQPPVQPYADRPPVYSSAAGAGALDSRELISTPARRRNTAMSDDTCPYVVRLARENRIEDLMAYLRGSGNVNEADPRSGRTAVMEAARLRRWDICRLLLQSGARLYLKDGEGDSVLHLASREGDSEICHMLLDSGAQTQDCNGEGETPLEVAAAGGHTQVVLCLINGMKSRKPNDPTIVKAFFKAVKLGDVPTAGALLAQDVKPKKLKDSWQPTCFAAQSGSIPMLELMLAQKCTLKDRSPTGWTALHYAARYGQQPMVEHLLDRKLPWKAQTKKGDETALHMAAAAGHTTTALALIAHKDANVTMKDADSQEAIHHAVRQGNIKLTTALIDQGAKLSTVNKYGWRPIHLAAAYGHVGLLAECMTRGISIEERTATPSFKPEKRTNAAARRGYWAEIRWPHSGARPLELALEFGHDDAAMMLVAGGAKVDEGDSRLWRPLHYAAFSCRPDMVNLLLERGATADAKTIDGHTALTLGFREYGLTADHTQRLRVVERLEIGMAGRKKSRMPSLTGFMSSAPTQSKTAVQRNLAWHTAQLAEALYQSNAGENDDDDDEYSVDSAEIGATNGSPTSAERCDMYGAPGSSSQSAKA